MNAESAYDELLRRSREKSVLASCAEMLAWDEVTYMPPAGAAHRAAQLALLAGLIHERGADPRIGELLAVVEASDIVSDLDSIPAANVRELRRLYDWDAKLPRRLVEEMARVTALRGDGVGGGSRQIRLRAIPAMAGKGHPSEPRIGGRGQFVGRSLRRAARLL